jgi:hypothetical protein
MARISIPNWGTNEAHKLEWEKETEKKKGTGIFFEGKEDGTI